MHACVCKCTCTRPQKGKNGEIRQLRSWKIPANAAEGICHVLHSLPPAGDLTLWQIADNPNLTLVRREGCALVNIPSKCPVVETEYRWADAPLLNMQNLLQKGRLCKFLVFCFLGWESWCLYQYTEHQRQQHLFNWSAAQTVFTILSSSENNSRVCLWTSCIPASVVSVSDNYPA